MESKKKKKIWKKLISQKKWNHKKNWMSNKNKIWKKLISQKKNEISKKMKSQKKMRSQKKWNQKISEHSQCQCHIMSESS